MTTAYPAALDSFTNPAADDNLNSPSHSEQHSAINDAIEAVESVLGIVGQRPFNVRDYGAVAGSDSTLAFQDTIDAAQVDGGEVVIPPGLFLFSDALDFGTTPIVFRGSGPSTVLKATSSIATGLLDIVGIKDSLFSDFTLDGNGLANNNFRMTIGTETSTRNVINRVRASGATDYQFYIQGHEDSILQDCYTPGSPALGVRIDMPQGAFFIRGGTLFGRMMLNEFQQIDIGSAVFGPVLVVNSGAAKDRTLNISGCYIYDASDYRCIDTATNLVNLQITGSYLVAQTWDCWCNGNVPAGVTLKFDSTMFVQAAGNGATTTYLVQTSDAGRVEFAGCSMTLNGGTSATAWRTVGGTAGYPAIRSPIVGVTYPTRQITTPTLPSSTTNYTNAFGTAAFVYVSGGTVTVIKVDGVTTGLTSGMVRVPVGSNISITYSSAPTWVWWGE